DALPILAGCAASWRACAVSPLVLRTITAGYVLQFAPSPSAIQRSDPICGAARAVSIPRGRDSLPAQKRSDEHSPSRGGSFRLLQALLPVSFGYEEVTAVEA